MDDYLTDKPDRTSLHRVRGDSMIEAGIFEGDLVVVEHESPTKAKAGDIVLAVVDGELTVKTLALDENGSPVVSIATQPVFLPTSGQVLLSRKSLHSKGILWSG